MSKAGKIVLLALFLALLPGCASKKTKTKAPAAAQAPTTTTTSGQAGAMYPPPFPEKTEAPPPPAPAPTQAEQTPAPEPPPQKKPSTKKKSSTANKNKPSAAKPATGEVASTSTAGAGTAAAPAPVQQTANVEPAGVSPIGQLASGEGSASATKRHEISDLINNTETGLNGIKRTLSETEQETATQIRTYLKQAKQALAVDDVDGANTLATKAKVLLEELTKP